MAEFFGYPLDEVVLPGLLATLEERDGAPYLQLRDADGPKWEIRPIEYTGERTKKVWTSLSLYHRSTREEGMHYQKRTARATTNGVRRLLEDIAEHEWFQKRGLAPH